MNDLVDVLARHVNSEPAIVRSWFRALEPAGYRIVPIEPTEEIIVAVQTEVDIWPKDKPKPAPNAVEFVSRDEAKAIWAAGLAAAKRVG
jgi:hypothetical protein